MRLWMPLSGCSGGRAVDVTGIFQNKEYLGVVRRSREHGLELMARKLASRKFSFGKPEAMERLLGIRPGAVSPLAVINDREGRVQVVIDASFRAADVINVHPLRNTAPSFRICSLRRRSAGTYFGRIPLHERL